MTIDGPPTNAFLELLANHHKTAKSRHILGVHDCVSAKIAEQAGFEAVWLSSLALSVAAGKCDRNELPWTSVADAIELIAESCDIPIILDGNEGYGDSSIARLFAVRAAARGAACISFEDKTYPKRNSFADGVELCSIEEFSAKLRSCKAALGPGSASLLARTDSLVASEDIGATLDRAHAYHEAGADAVIIHSKDSSVRQLEDFMSRWSNACPIVAIPTSYDQTDPEIFDALGIACVIWANQLIRSSIQAMQTVAQELAAQRNVGATRSRLVSVKETLAYADCGLGCAS